MSPINKVAAFDFVVIKFIVVINIIGIATDFEATILSKFEEISDSRFGWTTMTEQLIVLVSAGWGSLEVGTLLLR